MTKLTAMALSNTRMALVTQVSGKRMFSTVKVKRSGLMVPSMSVATRAVKSTEWVGSLSQMELSTRAPSSKETSMATASTAGPTASRTKASGRMERCMVGANSPPKMETSTKATS